MEELKKEENKNGHNLITIKTDEGEFTVSFDNNQDLYIGLCQKDSCENYDINFTITKEDYYLFEMIEKLYNNIKNRSENEKVLSNGFNINVIKPFENDKVRWISDDFSNEKGSELIISQIDDDSFRITFKKSQSKVYVNTYLVKIDTKGSYYYPFSDNFVEFYHDLVDYNYDFHQIHMDEYLFNKSRVRK